MNLNDFYDYKNQLMGDILTTKEIVKLINEDVPFEDAVSLAYTQVFPFEYIPETVEIGRTFVCFDVDVQKAMNKTFLVPTLYVWVFSHKSKLRLPEGGVRPDKLCAAICEKINGSRDYTLGELKIYAAKRFAPMTDYQGKVLTFTGTEFSRVYDPQKPIPSNRKTG